MSLHVYSTRYSRGAVVKLADSLSDQPLVKFVIERRKGDVFCIAHPAPGVGPLLTPHAVTLTESQLIEYAERECERIRTVLGGSDGSR